MKKLYSKAPSYLPPLPVLLGDLIGSKTPEAVGQHLGVSASTVRRWMHSGDAPRAAALALFWETRWGQSIVDCEAFNQARIQAGINRSLQSENASLRAQIARLEALVCGNFGAANDPYLAPPHPAHQMRSIQASPLHGHF